MAAEDNADHVLRTFRTDEVVSGQRRRKPGPPAPVLAVAEGAVCDIFFRAGGLCGPFPPSVGRPAPAMGGIASVSGDRVKIASVSFERLSWTTCAIGPATTLLSPRNPVLK